MFTTLPLSEMNLLGAVIFALLIPYLHVGRTLLYLDLRARQAGGTVPAAVAIAPAPPPESTAQSGRGSLPLPGARRPSRMISTRRGQRPVAGPTSVCAIRPSPQAIIGTSSQVKSLRRSPAR